MEERQSSKGRIHAGVKFQGKWGSEAFRAIRGASKGNFSIGQSARGGNPVSLLEFHHIDLSFASWFLVRPALIL